MQETWVWSLGGKIPWRREKLPTPVFWPGEFHGLYSPWGHKELDTTEQLSLHFLIYIWSKIDFVLTTRWKEINRRLNFHSFHKSHSFPIILPNTTLIFYPKGGNILYKIYTKCNRNANSHKGKYCFLFGESLGSLPKKASELVRCLPGSCATWTIWNRLFWELSYSGRKLSSNTTVLTVINSWGKNNQRLNPDRWTSSIHYLSYKASPRSLWQWSRQVLRSC